MQVKKLLLMSRNNMQNMEPNCKELKVGKVLICMHAIVVCLYEIIECKICDTVCMQVKKSMFNIVHNKKMSMMSRFQPDNFRMMTM